MKMSEYRSVNYYDLCRLCAATNGNKMNIFSPEARKINLHAQISECLPVQVEEKDRLPKIVCDGCLQQIQQIAKFRKQCVDAQSMLEGCLNQNKLKNEGKVYIKEENFKAIKAIGNPIKVTPSTNNVTIAAPTTSDFLSNIVQSVGIQMDDSTEVAQPQVQAMPQYTLTLDNGQTVRTNQSIQYTIKEMPQQTSQTIQATGCTLDEFLKMKEPVEQKTNTAQLINTSTPMIVATSSPQASKQIQLQDLIFSPSSKCFMPLKDGSNLGEAQIVTQVDNKKLVLPAYVQMKLQPQITTVNGQTYVQLTPTPVQTTTAQPQTIQVQQENIIPKNTELILTRSPNGVMKLQQQQSTPFTFANLTTTSPITSQAIELPKKIPQATITIQKSPGKQATATQITTIGRKGATTITRKTPVVLKQETSPVQVQKAPTTVTYSIAGTNASVAGTTTTKSVTLNQLKTKSMAPLKIYVANAAAPSAKPVQATTAPAIQTLKMEIHEEQVQEAKSAETVIATEVSNQPTCEKCSKVFKRKEHLVQHMKLHAGVRPFKCEEAHCNKAFNRKEHLMRHVVSHTGKKNFSCEYCHKFFSRKDNLNKHKRKHPEAELEGLEKRMKMDPDDEDDDN